MRAESKDLSGIGYIMLARDVMNRSITISKSTDLAEAAQIMYDKKISAIPVANSNYDLYGIITKTDILRALIETDKKTVSYN